MTEQDAVTRDGVSIKAIRRELGLSQSALARLVGFSTRAIQSCEQGWRKPGAGLEKAVLLLLMAHRNGGSIRRINCWEVLDCRPERCQDCITKRTGQGHLCWFLSGTLCSDQDAQDWEHKRSLCLSCKLFDRLLAGQEPAADEVL